MTYLPDGSVLERAKPINDGRSSYARWVDEQDIPVWEGFYLPDLATVALKPWAHRGADAAFIHLAGATEFNNSYVCELPPGGSTLPDKHLFEEIIYIVSGRGATSVRNARGDETTFEWRRGSLFAIPLNTAYQHFNGSGAEPARYYASTSAPLMMNLLHDRDAIFGIDFDFTGRFGAASDFSGAGQGYAERVWESNFISDVERLPLQTWAARGAGGSNIMLELADGSMCAHVSQFPVGTYKKAHRHGAGAHIVILAGEGYTLLWKEGNSPERVDWKPGSALAPPDQWFHQHFNLSPEPARYLAMRWGSAKNRVFAQYGVDRPTSQGGSQIEYEDEDPEIRKTFVDELRRRGLTPAVDARP